METFLNLVWLAVTVAAIWLWRFRWTVSRKNPRHSKRLEVVSIVCILALLFPVISLTDDLHPEFFPADTVSSKRNHGLLVANGDQASHSKLPSKLHSSFALLSRPPAEIELAFLHLLPPFAVLRPTIVSDNVVGRSPPSFV